MMCHIAHHDIVLKFGIRSKVLFFSLEDLVSHITTCVSLSRHLTDKTLGVDPRFISFEQATEWQGKWGVSGAGPRLKEVTMNLVDAIWTTRPEDAWPV